MRGLHFFARFKVNCEIMPLRSFKVNNESSWEGVARGPQKREALGHGLFGLCVNPSLTIGIAGYRKIYLFRNKARYVN